ncbi:MAG: electron transfer flavoprotein subunit beta/FixA family protein [Firmicutes bacterium]|nr:electron transfer flavoprotein subunit beta/FixA family protein [Bacillota bacterium]
MLRIVACFKWVIDEADIKVSGNSRELDLSRVAYKISDYDRNAIEEAVKLREQLGGHVVAVTVGPPEAKQSLKDALSRGPEKAVFVCDAAFNSLEPAQTAAILAEVIAKNLEYDLIICGEGSSDLYAQQVGPRLAEKLGIPCATYVEKITINDKELIAERKLEDGIEVVNMPLPALVTVMPSINTPRIPSLKQVLGAAKKPVVNLSAGDLEGKYEPCLKTTSVLAATMERKRIKLTDDPQDIQKVVDALIKEGVIN